MIARVADSEAILLTVARALVGQVSPDAVRFILRGSREIPLPRSTAMGLLKRTLAQGAVLQLGRRGGCWSSRHLKAGEPVTGRLWERHAPVALSFSRLSFRVIHWLASESMDAASPGALVAKEPLTAGDELVLYLSAELLVRTHCESAVTAAKAFHQSGLVRLAFPQLFPPDAGPVDWAKLVTGEAAIVLEALQTDLAAHVVKSEQEKSTIARCDRMLEVGGSQAATLTAYLPALERAGRRDLALCVMMAAAQIFRSAGAEQLWAGGLDPNASLRARTEARRASGALLRAIEQVHGWVEEARLTRFFDDGYGAAQALLSDWERLVGDGVLTRARAILRNLDSLDGAP